MAKNLVIKKPDNLLLTVPSGVQSGDPVMVGRIAGVALTDRDADGNATIRRKGVFELEVKGVHKIYDAQETEWIDEDIAVNIGDKLYYDATATPKINKNDHDGVFFGYALGAVDEGETNTIQVLLK